MYRLTLLAITLFTLTGCQQIKDKSKAAIKEGGNAVGQGASQFVDGVKDGVDLTFQSQIVVDSGLVHAGFRTGKFSIAKPDSVYILTVYGIYDRTVDRELFVRVYDEKGQEYGRGHTHATGHTGEAGYIDFRFDPRTDIESRSKFVLQ